MHCRFLLSLGRLFDSVLTCSRRFADLTVLRFSCVVNVKSVFQMRNCFRSIVVVVLS